MPAKIPSGKLTFRDLQVFHKHEIEGKTLDTTAEEMGISRDTVKRVKKREAYRNLVLQAMEEKGFTVDSYVNKLIGLTEAKKEINVGGDIHFVPDNPTQFKAIERIGKVYGDEAPKDVSITNQISVASDAELMEALDDVDIAYPSEEPEKEDEDNIDVL